jgi:V8-like Glu-specific endopeptidase
LVCWSSGAGRVNQLTVQDVTDTGYIATGDTEPGNSGSPVFTYKDGAMQVVAIHVSANTEARVGRRIIKNPKFGETLRL